MEISFDRIKELRERTKAGIMACKEALRDAEGDLERAEQVLRARGQVVRDKRAGRRTDQGFIGHYVHADGRIGVLVELLCETDFAARTDEFLRLARDLCMQIAAMRPVALDRESVPEEIIERERAVYREQVKDKPERIRDKIIAGKLEKFFQENVLLEQKFVKDTGKTIRQLLEELAASIGENIQLGRFVRMEIGE